nr:hypothetical protein CFP56_43035 [Quercus suber]
MYQYDDWLKATRGRARSPPRRKYGREESGVEVDRQADWFRQANHEEANGDGGGDKLQNPREHDPLRDKGNNDKHGTTLEGANVATEIKESMEATMKVMGSSIYVEQSSKVDDVAESMQELPVDPTLPPKSPMLLLHYPNPKEKGCFTHKKICRSVAPRIYRGATAGAVLDLSPQLLHLPLLHLVF